MRIFNDKTTILKIVDSAEYEWYFSDSFNMLNIWFNTEEIPIFLKYLRLRGYSITANLYKNGPDILGSSKRYFIAPFTQQQELQLEEIYGREKESFSNKPIEKRDIQMETKK